MRRTAAAERLDSTLMALAHPARREILRRLAEGDERVTALARPFAMSLNAVSKHIRVLERARMVGRRRSGREHVLSLRPEALDEAEMWLAEQRIAWAERLEALEEALRAEDRQTGKRLRRARRKRRELLEPQMDLRANQQPSMPPGQGHGGRLSKNENEETKTNEAPEEEKQR